METHDSRQRPRNKSVARASSVSKSNSSALMLGGLGFLGLAYALASLSTETNTESTSTNPYANTIFDHEDEKSFTVNGKKFEKSNLSKILYPNDFDLEAIEANKRLCTHINKHGYYLMFKTIKLADVKYPQPTIFWTSSEDVITASGFYGGKNPDGTYTIPGVTISGADSVTFYNAWKRLLENCFFNNRSLREKVLNEITPWIENNLAEKQCP